ncbi:MAG: alpha/beta hydrolase [Myxococcales bacterium]|nr:alpha/beta hydrolase [Myxococcales bacterium]
MSLPERMGLRLLNAQGLRSRYLHTSIGKVHALDAEGQGELPPVVLLHGLSANAAAYGTYLRRLIPLTQRVIAPDMPGHGLSDIPRGGLDRESMLAGSFEALDRLIDRPSILVGNSMGGLGVIRYALARPEKVRGLLLVSPGGAPMPEAAFQRFLSTFKIDTHQGALEFVDKIFAKSTPLVRHAFALGIRDRFTHPALRGLLDGITSEDMLRPEEVAALHLPTLLIWGREERILPRSHPAFFADHMPAHAEIEEWPDFGHVGFLEQAEGLVRRTVAFARGVCHERPRAAPSTLADERATLAVSA